MPGALLGDGRLELLGSLEPLGGLFLGGRLLGRDVVVALLHVAPVVEDGAAFGYLGLELLQPLAGVGERTLGT